MEADPLLVMSGISKSFPGVRALDDVRLRVRPGSVHALMGENGAGKSTLMNILIGIGRADSGSVSFRGKPVQFHSVGQALHAGISMIHQELCPVPQMTVAENIFLGREPTYRFGCWVNDKKMVRDTSALFDELEVPIDPRSKMADLNIANIQMVEIAKAISYDSALIIMDEPTSAITEKETSHLFRIIRSLKNRGVAVIYISHKLDEIFSIAGEITVLRDGRYVDTVPTDSVDRDRLIEMMVGRTLEQMFPKEEAALGEVFLDVKNLTREGVFRDVSFTVRSGEILGIAGLMGAGRTEIVESLFGIAPVDAGEIAVKGLCVESMTPKRAIKLGISLLTENRALSGLFLCHDVRTNIGVASIDRFLTCGFLNHPQIDQACRELVEALRIKTTGLSEIVQNLSGGNQQKVLIARWLLTEPDILILDEPTRGVDVGAKAEIHRCMSQLARRGKAIVMISSEMPEILGMSDRILVVREGEVSGVLSRREAMQDAIMRLAMGAEAKHAI